MHVGTLVYGIGKGETMNLRLSTSLPIAKRSKKHRGRERVLDENTVLEIIRLNAVLGLGNRRIGKRLGINPNTVQNAIDGKSFSWLTGRHYGIDKRTCLTLQLARRIKMLRSRGHSYREISDRTGVALRTVINLLDGTRQKHHALQSR